MVVSGVANPRSRAKGGHRRSSVWCHSRHHPPRCHHRILLPSAGSILFYRRQERWRRSDNVEAPNGVDGRSMAAARAETVLRRRRRSALALPAYPPSYIAPTSTKAPPDHHAIVNVRHSYSAQASPSYVSFRWEQCWSRRLGPP
ncbi:hypothetical protein E2562_020875 [Oryza meyeriana var. granulata]|uniref:Uncharacterized protein n=1 Tax=Oryza meyeriana var. granulata TaxID=110450 RepID=A0A6G1D5Y3_9ORYZ|nr:hypothetical protein E2562_020875 [Oryza meyeriana var. granulata]